MSGFDPASVLVLAALYLSMKIHTMKTLGSCSIVVPRGGGRRFTPLAALAAAWNTMSTQIYALQTAKGLEWG